MDPIDLFIECINANERVRKSSTLVIIISRGFATRHYSMENEHFLPSIFSSRGVTKFNEIIYPREDMLMCKYSGRSYKEIELTKVWFGLSPR
jgi:hypothetical protein